MILHQALPNVAPETFIWLPARSMAKVFMVFKEPIGHFWSGQKFWGEYKVEISNSFTRRYFRMGKKVIFFQHFVSTFVRPQKQIK